LNNDFENIKLHNIPGSVFVENRSGTLVVQVKSKRIYTGLKDTKINRKYAERQKELLYLEQVGLKKTTVIKRQYLNEIFDKYISEREINKAVKTIVSDKISFKTIIKKNIIVDRELIENCVKQMLKRENLSNESKNIYLRTFQTFLNWMHEHGYISERLNLKKKYYFKNIKHENKIFTKQEIFKIVDYFKNIDLEFSVLVEFLFRTGLRIGEALRLNWSDIKNNQIYLLNKTDKSHETILLSPAVNNLLLKIKTDRKKIFRWKDTSYSRLNRRFTKALENLEIEKDGRSFHELRKSFLFYLQRAGVPVEIAQKLMRHKNIRITIEYYQKIENKTLKENIEKFENSL
jgi:integrase